MTSSSLSLSASTREIRSLWRSSLSCDATSEHELFSRRWLVAWIIAFYPVKTFGTTPATTGWLPTPCRLGPASGVLAKNSHTEVRPSSKKKTTEKRPWRREQKSTRNSVAKFSWLCAERWCTASVRDIPFSSCVGHTLSWNVIITTVHEVVVLFSQRWRQQ